MALRLISTSADRDQETAERRTAFGREVRDALAHLHDLPYLHTCPLASAFRGKATGRAETVGWGLQQCLREALDALGPASQGRPGKTGRSPRVLHLRYVEGLSVVEVCGRLGISKTEYQRAHSRGLETVIAMIRDRLSPTPASQDASAAPAAPPGLTDPGAAHLPASLNDLTDTRRQEKGLLRHNLPAQLTSFVGREREIAEVRRLLGTTRLLTVTGPGGAGKTRLVLQVAADLLGDYPDGVCLAELAPLADPELVPQTVALALGVREVASEPILTTLRAHLGPRHLLLVLDNCEHLLDGAARLADALLRHCPQLRIAATSREPLGTAGETSWRLPSLALPDPGQPLPTERLLGYESIKLFVERASAARPGFELTERNATAVARICARLDGMPLALELAAARVRVLSAEQLAERLDDRFDLLTGGSRTALPRQQTLRAAIDWSYDLLSEPERVLFRRLSVFAGGWTLGAAEGVCAGDGLSAEEILDLLIKLADRSVVTVVEQTSEEPRYRLLETIRQYARDRLDESGEASAVGARHRDWYLVLAERAEPELWGADARHWLGQLERERDNLRAALEWCRRSDAALGLKLAAALWSFWTRRGHIAEGSRWLRAMLALAPEPTAARATALRGLGVLTRDLGDMPAATALLEESLRLCRDAGDREGIAGALMFLGLQSQDRGDYGQARALLEESLVIGRELANGAVAGYTLGHLGTVLRLQGDVDGAHRRFEEMLQHCRAHGDPLGRAIALMDLGLLARAVGDYARARALLTDALAARQEVGDRRGVALALSDLGELARAEGDLAEARALLEETAPIFREMGFRAFAAEKLASLADLATLEGDLATASAHLRESLTVLLSVGDVPRLCRSVRLSGLLALAQGAPDRALRLFAAAARHAPTAAPLEPAERVRYEAGLAAARHAPTEETAARAWAEGEAMTLAQAVAAALEMPPQVPPIGAAG
jgi:non-specific serine/threonine protein kinase